MAGWATSAVVRAAGGTDAGGDFYDVVPLPDERVALFLGDVMGRGAAAAAVMARVRCAVRTLIALDPSPHAVLAGLDRVFELLEPSRLVTMVYAVADPRGQVELINAGHPAPVLLTARGRTTVLEVPSTLLLGAGGGERAVRRWRLHPGDRLFLYTDGLVERRDDDADHASARLADALTAPRRGTLDEWLTAVVDDLHDPSTEAVDDDDVAALVLARMPSR